MRITIEVDRNTDPGQAPAAPVAPTFPAATFDVPDAGLPSEPPDAAQASVARSPWHPSGALDAGAAADPGPAAGQGVPADLQARAAALNAQSAGRAPDLSAHADAGTASTAHASSGSATGATADAPDPFACGMAAGEFDGITNAGGPAPGSGVDAG